MQTGTSNETYFDLVLIVIALVLLLAVIPAGVDVTGAEGQSSLLRPDFWPRVIAMVLLVASVAHLAHALLRGTSARPGPTAEKVTFNPVGAAAIVGILVFMLIAGRDVGLLAPAILSFVLVAFAIHPGHRLMKVILAIAVPLVVILFFEFVANIPMPFGRLFQGLLY